MYYFDDYYPELDNDSNDPYVEYDEEDYEYGPISCE